MLACAKKAWCGAAFAAVLFLSGCPAQRMYSGSPDSAGGEAYLDSRSVNVDTIDGQEVSVFGHGMRLLPGRHVLKAATAREGFLGSGEPDEPRDVEFDVIGGRTYLVKGSTLTGHCVWVEDEETGEVVSYDRRGCGAFKRGRR